MTLPDPITLLIATGLRRSELLGLRWIDYDAKAGVLTVTGKVIRVPGQGLLRVDETKSTAGRRTIPLPRFAIDMLEKRRQLPYVGQQPVIFPSTAGTLPQNGGHPHRRRGLIDADRGRPARPHPDHHDPRSLYEPRPRAHAGRQGRQATNPDPSPGALVGD